jgi:cytochrome c-type biogenesis protein CcmH
MKLKKGILGLSSLAGLFLALLMIRTASAQDPSPTPQTITDDQVNAIARQMYCPVCENTPLDVCPTQACAEWRELIRDELAQGWSEQQIKDYFVQRFGARVLATPPASGLNWLVYVIPPIAFLAGIFVLYRAFQSWKKPDFEAMPDAASQPGSDDPYIRQIEEELKKQ